jgi:exopolysaccharide biosynthesis polyprenyl glycosylphosphotransferase
MPPDDRVRRLTPLSGEALLAKPGLGFALEAVVSPNTREVIRKHHEIQGTRRGWLLRRTLLAADLVGLTLAFGVSELISGNRAGPFDTLSLRSEGLLFIVCLPIFALVALSYNLYARDKEAVSTIEEITGVFHLVTIGVWALVVCSWVLRVAAPNLPKLILFWGMAVTLILVARAAARSVARRHLAYVQNTIIVGAGAVGQLVARKFLHHPEYGINLVGFVDREPRPRDEELGSLPVFGSLERVSEIVRRLDVERIVIAFSSDEHGNVLDLIREVTELDVQIDVVPRLFEVISYTQAHVSEVEGLPLVSLRPLRLSRSSLLLKRTMDLVSASAGLVLLAVVFAVIALLIKLESAGPVFFRQRRVGADGEHFTILKFRTMVANAEAHRRDLEHLNRHALGGDPRLFKVRWDPRVTAIGRTLRRFSLDELPQLINVVRGEMSLVGPRPLVIDEHDHVETWALKRLSLKPGITGLWQMLGREEIPFGEMMRLDYMYVTSWSLFTDLKIILRTLPELFRTRKNGY